ncbi:MAG: hypothetical protein Q7J68_03240 [Thermoplasmata archaeon]|nr:hypothetical protein [Thermoplasmata archaeon]
MESIERNVIGILTSNVRLYYDLCKFLKARNHKFRILDFNIPIPPDIGVILTSPEELDEIIFTPKIAVADMENAIRQALQAMKGLGDKHVLIVGVDPGPEPGIAAILDGQIIETRQAHTLEQAADIIFGILSDYSYSQSILRIGDGAKEFRDRIIELVAANFNYFEIVDESSTSHCIRGYHEEAAVKIAQYGENPK